MKKRLYSYRNNQDCIKRLKYKLEELNARIKAIKSPSYTGMPKGGVPVSMEELLSDKIELENRIESLQKKSKEYKADIYSIIDTVNDVRQVEIMEAYFIGCKNFDEIAQEVGYSVRTVKRMFGTSLAFFWHKDGTQNSDNE